MTQKSPYNYRYLYKNMCHPCHPPQIMNRTVSQLLRIHIRTTIEDNLTLSNLLYFIIRVRQELPSCYHDLTIDNPLLKKLALSSESNTYFCLGNYMHTYIHVIRYTNCTSNFLLSRLIVCDFSRLVFCFTYGFLLKLAEIKCI